jgi:nicotinamide riboside transporter PnuC
MSPQIDITPRSCPDFHIEEFKLLRTEIMADSAELGRIEQLSATAIGAIWVWILGRSQPSSPFIVLIPILVAASGWLRWNTQFKGLYGVADYIKLLEEQYAELPLLGWEHFVDERRTELLKNKKLTVKRAGDLFWALISVVTVVLAIAYVNGYMPTPAAPTVTALSGQATTFRQTPQLPNQTQTAPGRPRVP